MRIKVLGSSAGGGLPQWNCNCSNCQKARRHDPAIQSRTQDSIMVSHDNENWVLINASPDIRQQFENCEALHPQSGVRDTKIQAIILVDSQIDHTTGLLSLREAKTLNLYATQNVYDDLTGRFPLIPLLEHYCEVKFHTIMLNNTPFKISGISHLEFTPLAIKSKAPPYSPNRQNTQVGDTIGVSIKDTQSGLSLFYTSCLGEFTDEIIKVMENADCILVDGTFWTEDEMIKLNIAHKYAAEMGHLPLSGPEGTLALLAKLEKPRKILIHINNTNPVLDTTSKEHAMLKQAGFELAYDGLEIHL